MDKTKNIWAKPFAVGALASLSLAIAYFAILSLLNSFPHAVQTFLQLWYFMLLLILGFGLQMALLSYIRNAHKNGLCHFAAKGAASTVSTAASGSVSTASMVACCLHHVSDVAPFLGVSAAVVFFDKFQSFFMLLGIFSSILGTLFMLRIIQKDSLFSEKQLFVSKIMKKDLDTILKLSFVFSAAILLLAFLLSLE